MLYEKNGTIYIDERVSGDVFAEERKAARIRRAELAASYDELLEAVKLAEEAASYELAALGNYDAIPSNIEAFGQHDAIETQIAGIYGMSDRAFSESDWWN